MSTSTIAAMITASMALATTLPALAARGDFVDLFGSHTLAGWRQLGGRATFEIEDGVVVGTAVAGTPNSFLCSERSYGDFVLELDFEVDSGLNSGVQIRSHAYEEPTLVRVRGSDGEVQERTMPAGRVHGYQVEIDPSPRAWSGGIYDEARRGWLYDLAGEEHEAARAALRPGEWNRLRIEAVGPRIRTWLNGVPAADLNDELTSEGFLCLQVHSVAAELAGREIRWRDVRLREVGDAGASTE